MKNRHDLRIEEVEDSDKQSSVSGYLEVELSEEETQLLEKWIGDHLNEIEKQMVEVFARLESERNRHEGLIPVSDYPYQGAFRYNYPVTKKKVRESSNKVKQAFLDSDPIWAVTSDDPELRKYAQDVEYGLDRQVDNKLEATDDLAQAFFECRLHGTGLIEPGWEYIEDVTKDMEFYEGYSPLDPESIRGIDRFIRNYPNYKEEKEALSVYMSLKNGKSREIFVSYVAPIRNSPCLSFIPLNDSRVYPNVEGYAGLRITPVYGYVKNFTRVELEEKAESGLISEAALSRVLGIRQETSALDEVELFQVFVATIRYRFKGDDRPTRYKVWYERSTGTVLRIRGFQWWYNQPDLIPIYSRMEEPGFYKRGLAWDLKENHIVTTVMMNLYLNGADMANSMRWVVKEGSPAEKHLLSRRWSPHMPLPYSSESDRPQSAATPTNHLGVLLEAFRILRMVGDEESSTSSYQSGRESPTDPTAPATKVALLLREMEPNTKEVIRSMEQGMREIGRWTLWLYYQGIKMGWIDGFPGVENLPVEVLKEVAEKLEPRAILFESDREGRMQRNLMVYKLIAESVGRTRPDLVGKALDIVVSQVDSQWAKVADQFDFEGAMKPAPGQQGEMPSVIPSATNGNGGGNVTADLTNRVLSGARS